MHPKLTQGLAEHKGVFCVWIQLNMAEQSQFTFTAQVMFHWISQQVSGVSCCFDLILAQSGGSTVGVGTFYKRGHVILRFYLDFMALESELWLKGNWFSHVLYLILLICPL